MNRPLGLSNLYLEWPLETNKYKSERLDSGASARNSDRRGKSVSADKGPTCTVSRELRFSMPMQYSLNSDGYQQSQRDESYCQEKSDLTTHLEAEL